MMHVENQQMTVLPGLGQPHSQQRRFAGIEWPDKAVEINNTYSSAMEVLTKTWLDYLIGDAHYLDKAEVIVTKKEEVKLQIGTHEFSVLVLPPLFILSQSTSQKILEFAKAGGNIVILGDLPKGSPQVGLIDPRVQSDMEEMLKFPSVIKTISVTFLSVSIAFLAKGAVL